EARFLDHGEREEVIGQEGRELQLRLLEATFAIDSAREERPGEPVVSAAASGTACHRSLSGPVPRPGPAATRPASRPPAPGHRGSTWRGRRTSAPGRAARA